MSLHQAMYLCEHRMLPGLFWSNPKQFLGKNVSGTRKR